jgi:hypothetical protein
MPPDFPEIIIAVLLTAHPAASMATAEEADVVLADVPGALSAESFPPLALVGTAQYCQFKSFSAADEQDGHR